MRRRILTVERIERLHVVWDGDQTEREICQHLEEQQFRGTGYSIRLIEGGAPDADGWRVHEHTDLPESLSGALVPGDEAGSPYGCLNQRSAPEGKHIHSIDGEDWVTDGVIALRAGLWRLVQFGYFAQSWIGAHPRIAPTIADLRAAAYTTFDRGAIGVVKHGDYGQAHVGTVTFMAEYLPLLDGCTVAVATGAPYHIMAVDDEGLVAAIIMPTRNGGAR